MLIADWAKGPGGTGEATFGSNDFFKEFETGNLAESWEILDPDTVIFHLRKGVNFALNPEYEASRLVNGREMVAEDVAFSFRRAFIKGTYMDTNWPGWFKSATATDKYTCVIKGHDSEENRTTMCFNNLCQTVKVWPPEVIAKYGNTLDWRNVVGTGPFMLVDYVSSSSMTLVRNPNYHMKDPLHPENQLPYADKLVLLDIYDLSTSYAALRVGKIDMLSSNEAVTSADDAKLFMEKSPELQWSKQLGTYWNISARVDSKPFDDVRVRRALQMAINSQEIKDKYYRGDAEILFYPVPPSPEFKSLGLFTPLEELPESIQELYSYNPEKAKKLLAEAGYPNGFKTNILCPSSPDYVVDFLSVMKAYWAKIGVDLTLNIKESAAYTSMLNNQRYDQIVTASRGLLDPLKYTFYDFKPGGSMNRAMVNDPYLNERGTEVWKWENINNQALRIKLGKEGVVRVLDQAYLIQLPAPYQYSFWQPWIGNYHGEFGTGQHSQRGFVRFIWVDQDVKKMYGR